MDRTSAAANALLAREAVRAGRRSLSTALGLADEELAPHLAEVDQRWPHLHDAERLRVARLAQHAAEVYARSGRCVVCAMVDVRRPGTASKLMALPFSINGQTAACLDCLGRAFASIGAPSAGERCSACPSRPAMVWPAVSYAPVQVRACSDHLRSALEALITPLEGA